MYAAKAQITSFAIKNGLSPKFSSRAIKPLPSVARLVRTHTSVSCASSQFRTNRRMHLERGPILESILPGTNLVKLLPFNSGTPKPNGVGVPCCYGRNERLVFRSTATKLLIATLFREPLQEATSSAGIIRRFGESCSTRVPGGT